MSSKESLLDKIRSVVGYRFTLYDDALTHRHRREAGEYLQKSRAFLFSTDGLIDDVLLLAKSSCDKCSVLLYVDRDYFELAMRKDGKQKHLESWQFTSDFSGKSITEIEIIMGKYLI